MTNSYDVDHGLSQCHPGPLEPVEIAQQPGAAPATGNTARDQEMYAAGIRTGEENAKHNAAIRAGVPSGWKLVPIEPTDAMLDAGIKQHRCEQGDPWYSSPDLGEGDCRDIYAAMLNAAPAAPGVSTVEDERQAFEAWAEDQGFVLDCDFFEVSGQYYDQDDTQLAYDIWRAARASVAAPAAGDALDAARYRWLRVEANKVEQFGSFSPYVIQGQTANLLSGESLDACVDAAIAAQRKGDA